MVAFRVRHGCVWGAKHCTVQKHNSLLHTYIKEHVEKADALLVNLYSKTNGCAVCKPSLSWITVLATAVAFLLGTKQGIHCK